MAARRLDSKKKKTAHVHACRLRLFESTGDVLLVLYPPTPCQPASAFCVCVSVVSIASCLVPWTLVGAGRETSDSQTLQDGAREAFCLSPFHRPNGTLQTLRSVPAVNWRNQRLHAWLQCRRQTWVAETSNLARWYTLVRWTPVHGC